MRGKSRCTMIVFAASMLVWVAPAVARDGDGRAILSFTDLQGRVVEGNRLEVPVDTRGTWTIFYIVGPGGMAKGGGIWAKRLGSWEYQLGLAMQVEDPAGDDFVTCDTISTTGRAQIVVKDLGRYFKVQHMLHAVVTDGYLAEGDRIVLTVGDRSAGGRGSLTRAVSAPSRRLYIQSDTDGDGTYANSPQPLWVSLLPGPATHFQVVAPSIVKLGDKLPVIVRAEDINSNICPRFDDSPTLIVKSSEEGADPRAAFDPFQRSATPVFIEGIARFESVARTPGVYYIRVRAKDGLTGRSNPVRVVPADDSTPRLYWGDTHVHTYESDGTGDLVENYLFARDVAALDFSCSSDHLMPEPPEGLKFTPDVIQAIDDGFLQPTDLKGWWTTACDTADRFHVPGRFVTFYSYEWSGTRTIGGDHNPILADRTQLPASDDLNELYRILERMDRGDNVVIIPHVGGRIGNWDFHSPQVEMEAEVASVHGHFEWFGQEALQKGYKVGFMGAGDGHHGRPGYAVWQRFGRMQLSTPFGGKNRSYGVPSAITGAYADELTRKGVIKAFRDRHVFATTGHRPIVDFRVNGAPMGSELQAASAPVITVDVWGTTDVTRIDLIRNDKRIRRWDGAALHAQLQFTDTTAPQGASYYYARICQQDGEWAWSSPVFVNHTGPEADPGRRAELPAWNDEGDQANWLRERPQMPKDHRPALEAELERLAPGRFKDLHQVQWVVNARGNYAVFLGTDARYENRPVRIHFFPEFAEPRLHFTVGYADYGQTPDSKDVVFGTAK